MRHSLSLFEPSDSLFPFFTLKEGTSLRLRRRFLGEKSRIIHKRRKSDQSSFQTSAEEESKENTTTSNLKTSESTSSKEVCISVLLDNGLLFNKENNSKVYDTEAYVGEESLKCESCGGTGKNKKMVICDRCDRAFHLTCSGVLDYDDKWFDWYCHPCSFIKPKRFVPKLDSESEKLKSRRYRFSVRIGEHYQVEVEEWTGLVYDDDGYFDNPRETDPAEFIQVPKVQKHVNWLQCKFCGKWRRAPFNEVQSRDWDCSCAVQWDPIHADCVVPQELETAEVLKEAERINLLRRKFAEKVNSLK